MKFVAVIREVNAIPNDHISSILIPVERIKSVTLFEDDNVPDYIYTDDGCYIPQYGGGCFAASIIEISTTRGY